MCTLSIESLKEFFFNPNSVKDMREDNQCRIRIYHLVLRKGIMIPAPVATSKRTTWSTVSTTLISLTTNALALLLSKPSNVTYCWCCCCWCSIFHIFVWQLSSISCMSLKRSSLWYWTFSSISVIVCLRFSTSFWCSSVKSFICSSRRSDLKRSSCSECERYATSCWRACIVMENVG